ncbi:MAG TPA: efflux RND transporter periplasmic adaptor subunit [Candidatus Binatia bacterium]|nr:efflux RND transporter periplasmic adaptor subunit [Candidatus Binatia bacterium]
MDARSTPGAARPRSSAAVRWLAAVLAVCVVSAGFVVARTRRVASERSERERTLARGPRVLVTAVRHAPEEREIALPATIHGFVETPIYAKIAGYLKTIRVDKGDRVRQGELLAVLDSPELDKQVADMEADYAIKALTARRDRAVAKAGALSQEEADVAQADAAKAKATLEQYRALQAYERITAPVDGVITARYVDPGALIPQATSPAASGTPILAIATLQPLRVYAHVPQDLTPFIRDGDPAVVTVTQYPRRTFAGSVTRHPEALSPDTRTMLVEVDLPNADSALLPGMYGTLRLRVSQPDVARVPDDALVFRDGKVYVPTVRNDRLHLAEVTLGYDDGREVEVLSGIADDDVIALNVGQGVQEGDPVQAVRADAEAPAAGRD